MMINSSTPVKFVVTTLLLLCFATSGCTADARKGRTLARAEKFFKAGEYDKARIEYMSVLRRHGEDLTSIRRLGQIWSEGGAPLRAIPFLFKVRELDPSDSDTRNRLAKVMFAYGQLGEARAEALAVLQQDPANASALLMLTSTTGTLEQLEETKRAFSAFPDKDSSGYHVALGNLTARQGNPALAEAEFRKALALDDKSPLAHLALGLLSNARGDRNTASQQINAASQLSPLRSGERLQYAEFLAAGGELESAKTEASEVTQKAPDFLPAWRFLAQIALREKKPEEAIALLENVFGRDPQDLEGGILRSQALIAKGEVKQAIERLESADASFQGKVPLLKFRLGEAYIRDNNREKAAATLNQAIAANPDYLEPVLALASLNLQAGDAAQVVAAMSDLLRKRPDLAQARILLATAHQRLGQLDEAADLLREQARLSPLDPESQLLLGTVLRQQNQIPEAREAFQRAVGLSPNNIQPLAALIGLEIAEKNFPVAMERARSLKEKDPKSAAGPFFEGSVHFAQQDWDAAESAVEASLALDPNFGDAHSLLINIYLAANRLPQAAARLEEIVERNPNNPQAFMTLAMIRERMLEFPKAAEAYEKFLALTPDAATALNNLAYIYTEHLNQPQKAVDLARRARAAEPNNPAIADTLGWALFKQQDYAQALALFQESAPALAEVPDAQFHLGMANYMMGRPEDARAAFERALARGKDFSGKEEAERHLALLQTGGTGQPQSRESLENHVSAQPADILGWMRLGELHESEKAFQAAADAYEKARQLNPNLLSANLKLAQLYAGPLREKEKALGFAKKARELAPADAEVGALLGRVAYQAGNFTWAHSLLQESARRRGDDSRLLYDLAMASYATGNIPEARATMERVLQLAPAAGPSQEGAQRLLKFTALSPASTDLEAAAADIDAALQAEPDFVPALMARGAVQSRRGNPDAAIDTYTEVLRLYRDFAPAQKRLAALYATRPADLTKADELATAARRTLSADSELLRISGEIKFKQKDHAAAARLLQQSAHQTPLDPVGLYYLGMAQLETAQAPQGRSTLERALAAGLPEPMAQETRGRLEQEPPK